MSKSRVVFVSVMTAAVWLVSCGLTSFENPSSYQASRSQNLESPKCASPSYYAMERSAPVAGYYVFDADPRASMSFYYDQQGRANAVLQYCHPDNTCTKFFIPNLQWKPDWPGYSGKFESDGQLDSTLEFQRDGTVKISCQFGVPFCGSRQLGRFKADHAGAPDHLTCPKKWEISSFPDPCRTAEYVRCQSEYGADICSGEATYNCTAINHVNDAGQSVPAGVATDEGGVGGVREGFQGQFVCDQSALERICSSQSVPNGMTCEAHIESCTCACVDSSY